MFRRWIIFWLFLFSCISANSAAVEINSKKIQYIETSLKSRIEELLRHQLPNANIGIVVMNAKTGNILYQRQAYQPFTPASNLKLFTAAAALIYLKPDYQFATQVLLNKNQKHGKIVAGDVVIRFRGDPSLTEKNLQDLMAAVRKKGIRKIKGNIIIDDNYFSGPTFAPGWCLDDRNWYYAAPVSSIIVNQNAVPVSISPSHILGHLASIKLDLPSPFFKVSSRVKTVTFKQAEKNCSLNPEINSRNHIYFSGCWPIGKNAGFRMAIVNPALFAKQVISFALRQEGIKLQGKIIAGSASKNDTVLVEHLSPTLKQLIRTMLKQSDNIYAESMTKTLGKKLFGVGSFQQGVNAIEKILKPVTGIDFKQTAIFDGSGTSRYDLITPMQLARLLYVMANSPQFSKEFIRALPIAGKDGTLDKRMQAFDVKNKVAAKTGSLNGVSSLAGYITTEDRQQLLFVVMMDHIVGKIDQARQTQGEIAAMLYTHRTSRCGVYHPSLTAS